MPLNHVVEVMADLACHDLSSSMHYILLDVDQTNYKLNATGKRPLMQKKVLAVVAGWLPAPYLTAVAAATDGVAYSTAID